MQVDLFIKFGKRRYVVADRFGEERVRSSDGVQVRLSNS